jgi:hypothetical protein
MNTDLVSRARWSDLYSFFADGYPPLIMQILALNTIFLVLFVYRRIRAKNKMRGSTVYFLQGALIAINMVVIFQKEAVSIVNTIQRLT